MLAVSLCFLLLHPFILCSVECVGDMVDSLPSIAYNPWISGTLFKILLAKDPLLLHQVLAHFKYPLVYDHLAGSHFIYTSPYREGKYLPNYTENIANSQPFGAYKYNSLI